MFTGCLFKGIGSLKGMGAGDFHLPMFAALRADD